MRLAAVAVLSRVALLADAFSAPSRPRARCPPALLAVAPFEPASPPPLPSTAAARRDEREGEGSSILVRRSARTSRRHFARTAAALLLAASAPRRSLAAGESKSSNRSDGDGVVSQSKIASLLEPIPTFAIVDDRGVPYFVVGEDAKLTSYFFLDYEEARRILSVAVASSDKALREAQKGARGGEDAGANPWKTARIASVPLDAAVALASKGKLAGAYFKLAPSPADIEDGLALDGSDDLPEGKVPLFYVEDMTLPDGGEPLYFHRGQALAEWRRQNKRPASKEGDDDDSPKVKVTELFATLSEMRRPGGDEELGTLQFVAPTESGARAEQCRRGEREPFRLGERIVVL